MFLFHFLKEFIGVQSCVSLWEPSEVFHIRIFHMFRSASTPLLFCTSFLFCPHCQLTFQSISFDDQRFVSVSLVFPGSENLYCWQFCSFLSWIQIKVEELREERDRCTLTIGSSLSIFSKIPIVFYYTFELYHPDSQIENSRLCASKFVLWANLELDFAGKR